MTNKVHVFLLISSSLCAMENAHVKSILEYEKERTNAYCRDALVCCAGGAAFLIVAASNMSESIVPTGVLPASLVCFTIGADNCSRSVFHNYGCEKADAWCAARCLNCCKRSRRHSAPAIPEPLASPVSEELVSIQDDKSEPLLAE